MTYTLLMTAILIVSFGLMVPLVQFSETIITRGTPVELPVHDGDAAARTAERLGHQE